MDFNIDNLVEVLSSYFGVNSKEGSYFYGLTRDKAGFSYGTVSIDDFEEVDEDQVYDLAEYLCENFKQKEVER